MAILTINIIVDLKQVLNIDKFSTRNRPLLLVKAAERYVQFLQDRYITYALGGGTWPPLKEETIKRKERRGVASDPTAILLESEDLFNNIKVRRRGNTLYVGYVRNVAHFRHPSVTRLVTIHAKGQGRNPVRRIMALPDDATRKQMVEDIRRAYNAEIQRNKRVR